MIRLKYQITVILSHEELFMTEVAEEVAGASLAEMFRKRFPPREGFRIVVKELATEETVYTNSQTFLKKVHDRRQDRMEGQE